MKKVLLVDNGSSYTAKLLVLLESADTQVKLIDYQALKKQDAEAMDLVVLSGGHVHTIVDHLDYYQKEINLIRETCIALIGVCLGFELIAVAYGAVLSELSVSQKGIRQIHFGEASDLTIQDLQVYENHRYAVSNVSAPLRVLASSETGVEVIQHEFKPVYAMQFHPEVFVDEQQGDEYFKQLVGELIH